MCSFYLYMCNAVFISRYARHQWVSSLVLNTGGLSVCKCPPVSLRYYLQSRLLSSGWSAANAASIIPHVSFNQLMVHNLLEILPVSYLHSLLCFEFNSLPYFALSAVRKSFRHATAPPVSRFPLPPFPIFPLPLPPFPCSLCSDGVKRKELLSLIKVAIVKELLI